MRHLLRSPSESNVNDVNPWSAQTLNASVINAMQPFFHYPIRGWSLSQETRLGTFLQIKEAWGHFPMDFTLGFTLAVNTM